MGGSFDGDLTPNINDGYPILKWQNPNTEYGIRLTATPANATVVVTSGDTPLTPVSSDGGVYIFSPLATGTYEYTVSEAAGDYIQESGTLTVGFADAIKTVTLQRNTYTVAFAVMPGDAVVSIAEAGSEQSKTASGGVASFTLPAGTYTYSVDKFGYATEIGTVTVEKGPGAVTTTVNLTENTKYDLTFSITPVGVALTVTHATQGVQTPVSGTTYNLYEGETYSYTVRQSGYFTVKDTVTMGGGDDTITITMEVGVASWDGVSRTEAALVDGVYQISDPEHLAWFRDKVNSDLIVSTSGNNGSQVINNSTSSTRNVILLNDIDLGGYEWAPIGTYTTGNYSATAPVGFAGTFDGNGNTITGLSITTGTNGSGLFGVLMGGTVKDLTVEGSIRGGQYTGGIVGYSTGNATKYPNGATISNCVSYVDITATRFIGGITGYLAGNVSPYTSLIEYCMNYGTIASSTSGDYIGGIVGNASGTMGVKYCGNEGNVSGGDSVGGVVGNGSMPITGCYNAGNVTGSSANTNVGGIVGFTNNANNSTITDCYNIGNITGTNRVGGIIGWMNNTTVTSPASIDTAYNVGTITGTGVAVGAIIGEKNSATNGGKLVINAHYLAGTAAIGIGSNAHADDEAEAKTAAEMKTGEFLDLLGAAFQEAGFANGGYPILIWQTAGVDYLAQAKVAKIAVINAVKNGLMEARYTVESWVALLEAIDGAISDVNAATTIPEVDAVTIPDPSAILDLIPAGDSVTVYISYQADDTGFYIAKQEFTVTADLAEKYGYTDSFNTQKVSALDAIVAAHITIFGDDVSIINSVLSVGGTGWIANFMNDGTGSYVYIINGNFAVDIPGEMELSAGDYIQLQSMQDTIMWRDTLTWFEYEGGRANAITVEAGQDFVLTLKGAEAITWQDPSDLAITNISGASIVEVGIVDNALFNGESLGYFEDVIGITVSGGTVTLNYAGPGIYIMSAIRSSGTPLISPWLVVTVIEEGALPDVDKTALNSLIVQAQAKDEDDYESGWSEFIAALDAAISVAEDDNATLAEVNSAINALNLAMNALVVKVGELPDWEEVMNTAFKYIQSKVTTPGYGNEWAILALARSGYLDTEYYDGYYSRVLAAIASRGVKLDANMSTDNSRLILALTALGIDASSAGGKDLVAPLLSDKGWVTGQGINGAIYALLAIDSAPYGADDSVKQALVDYILDGQISGGWGMAGSATVDMTAMALQALAPYSSQPAVKAAVEDALDWLDTKTISDAENNAQVIVALSALGLDAEDYVNALLTYYDVVSGGFKHSPSVNLMATEQAAYALVAYSRFLNEQNTLYDMSDATKLVSDDVTPTKVDKSALIAKIAEAEDYTQSSYTTASWSVLSAALTNARTVRDDENASQGEVDATTIRLTSAINTLTRAGSGVTASYVRISVTNPNARGSQIKVYFTNTQFEMNNNETAYTLLLRTGLDIRTSTQSQYVGVYVASINGFGEFSDGPTSGWRFRVTRGGTTVFPNVSASLYFLQDGDIVEWMYNTRDLGGDVGDSTGDTGGNGTENKEIIEIVDDKTPLGQFGEWTDPFDDVEEADWFYEEVKYAFENGLMNGTAANMFSPNTNLSRAMIVTILYRLEGEPTVTSSEPFNDVAAGQWYTDAIVWASTNGIVEGYGNSKFGPNDDITREQLATILCRYAAWTGLDTSETANLSGYTDAGQISDWALDAMKWANAERLITGRTATTLVPAGTATRSEAATILMRFMSRYASWAYPWTTPVL